MLFSKINVVVVINEFLIFTPTSLLIVWIVHLTLIPRLLFHFCPKLTRLPHYVWLAGADPEIDEGKHA